MMADVVIAGTACRLPGIDNPDQFWSHIMRKPGAAPEAPPEAPPGAPLGAPSGAPSGAPPGAAPAKAPDNRTGEGGHPIEGVEQTAPLTSHIKHDGCDIQHFRLHPRQADNCDPQGT